MQASCHLWSSQFRVSRNDGDYWLGSTLFTWWKQCATRFQINEAANSRQKPNSRPNVENTHLRASRKLKARHSLSLPFGLPKRFNNIISEEYPSDPTLTTRLPHLKLIQGESRWYANAYTQVLMAKQKIDFKVWSVGSRLDDSERLWVPISSITATVTITYPLGYKSSQFY